MITTKWSPYGLHFCLSKWQTRIITQKENYSNMLSNIFLFFRSKCLFFDKNFVIYKEKNISPHTDCPQRNHINAGSCNPLFDLLFPMALHFLPVFLALPLLYAIRRFMSIPCIFFPILRRSFLCWHLMRMRSVLMWIFNLVIIRIIHSLVKLLLCQPFFFCLLNLAPVFMPCFMA